MISIDGSLIIQIINFLVLMIVLNFLLYRPIRKILQDRRELYDGFESDIYGLTSRTEERMSEMEARMAEARRDGFKQKDELKDQGLDEEKRIVSTASDDADANLEKVRSEIRTEIESARGALAGEVESFSSELAHKILGRSVS